jgi:hypothetical protein
VGSSGGGVSGGGGRPASSAWMLAGRRISILFGVFSPRTSRRARSRGKSGQRAQRGGTPEKKRTRQSPNQASCSEAPGHLAGVVAGDRFAVCAHLACPPGSDPVEQAGEAAKEGAVVVETEADAVAAGLDLFAVAAALLRLGQGGGKPTRAGGAKRDGQTPFRHRFGDPNGAGRNGGMVAREGERQRDQQAGADRGRGGRGDPRPAAEPQTRQPIGARAARAGRARRCRPAAAIVTGLESGARRGAKRRRQPNATVWRFSTTRRGAGELVLQIRDANL